MTHILVFTNSFDDPHVDAVRPHVERLHGSLTRIDVDRVIKGETAVSWDYQGRGLMFHVNGRPLNLSDVTSVWYRKPFGFGARWGFVESVNDPVQRRLVRAEVMALFRAIFVAMSDRFWLNSPEAIERAALKPYQLAVAKDHNILTPATIVTSDPDEAKRFCREGPTVFKPLVQAELRYHDTTLTADTTLLSESHIKRMSLIRSQPVLLQRYINKRAELRATYIGGEFFVAEQRLTRGRVESDIVDWRTLQGGDESDYTVGELPEAVREPVRDLLIELELGFAAVDFAVDQNGDIFFLEVNPNGQWLGYTERLGLPAPEALARCLVRQTRLL